MATVKMMTRMRVGNEISDNYGNSIKGNNRRWFRYCKKRKI